jgi:hypothetical protein
MRVISLLVFAVCFLLVGSIVAWRFTATRPPSPEVIGGMRPVSVSASSGWTEIRYGHVPEGFVPPLPDFDLTPPPISIDLASDTEGGLLRVSVLYVRPEIPGYPMPSDFSGQEGDAIDADYTALRETVVLRCLYKEADGVRAYHYWYEKTPPLAACDRLQARSAKHPLLGVKAPWMNCPATFAEADSSQ